MTRGVHPSSMRRPASPSTGVARLADGRFPTVGLLALAAAIFISMTSEFLPGGLLQQIGQEFDRSLAVTGQLVTVFAAAVIVSATPLAFATRRVKRKTLAVIALAGIVSANVAIALAPSFELLVAGRIFGGIAHGLFWSVAAAYAADLVPSAALGRATAITAGGGSLAGVLGLPIGNALGQTFGWRVAFGAMAVLGLIVLCVTVVTLPQVQQSPRAPRAGGGDGVRAASHLGGVLMVCLTILFIVIGQTTLGTYIVPWLEDIAHYPPPVIPLHLLASGLAAFVGITIVGFTADRAPRVSLIVGALLVIVANIAYVIFAPFGVLAVFVVSAVAAMAFAAIPVLLQARMMRIAAPHQRSAAAALQTTAFNIAIGGGAIIGGILIENAGLAVLPWAAVVVTSIGLLLVFASDAVSLARRRRTG